MGGLVDMAGPGPVGCQALPCAEAAGCWLAGLGHEAAGCRTPGAPRANADSLMGRAGSWGGYLQGLGS